MANYKDPTRKCGLCRKWSLVGLIWGSENIRKRPGMMVDPNNKGSTIKVEYRISSYCGVLSMPYTIIPGVP